MYSIVLSVLTVPSLPCNHCYSQPQNGSVPLTGGIAQPPPPEPKPESGPSRRLSEHDRVNNTNALELLQSGAFKLVPGQDTVPYEKLMGLRLEDGIDVTRKVGWNLCRVVVCAVLAVGHWPRLMAYTLVGMHFGWHA